MRYSDITDLILIRIDLNRFIVLKSVYRILNWIYDGKPVYPITNSMP